MKKLKYCFLSKTCKAITSLLTKIKYFYKQVVYPVLAKIGVILTHNFIINKKGQKLILVSFITIKITRKRRIAFYGYLFVSLWMFGFVLFTLYPMFYSLYLSFHEAYYSLELGITTQFIGFQNYISVFRSQILLPLYIAYIGKMILAVPLVVVFSIIIAVLINNPIKLKGLWRTVFFLPVVISTGPVIRELSNQEATSLPSLDESQILLYVVDNLGSFIADPLQTLLSSMLLTLWYAGIPILIFLAGLQKIDNSIYEAAAIDGVSPWDRFWKITLPSIYPLIGVSIIFIVVSMSLFVEPGGILDLAKTHMLVGAPDSSWWHGYGYSAAIAWIYFVLMVLLMLLFIGITSIRRKER